MINKMKKVGIKFTEQELVYIYSELRKNNFIRSNDVIEKVSDELRRSKDSVWTIMWRINQLIDGDEKGRYASRLLKKVVHKMLLDDTTVESVSPELSNREGMTLLEKIEVVINEYLVEFVDDYERVVKENVEFRHEVKTLNSKLVEVENVKNKITDTSNTILDRIKSIRKNRYDMQF